MLYSKKKDTKKRFVYNCQNNLLQISGVQFPLE